MRKKAGKRVTNLASLAVIIANVKTKFRQEMTRDVVGTRPTNSAKQFYLAKRAAHTHNVNIMMASISPEMINVSDSILFAICMLQSG